MRRRVLGVSCRSSPRATTTRPGASAKLTAQSVSHHGPSPQVHMHTALRRCSGSEACWDFRGVCRVCRWPRLHTRDLFSSPRSLDCNFHFEVKVPRPAPQWAACGCALPMGTLGTAQAPLSPARSQERHVLPWCFVFHKPPSCPVVSPEGLLLGGTRPELPRPEPAACLPRPDLLF